MFREERLVSLASAVVEGADVKWDEVDEQSLDERERSVLRELRVLAEIAEVSRDPSVHKTQPVSSPSPDTRQPAAWGHLRVVNAIRRGAFGSVYRAWDSRLEREVALKLMHPSAELGSFDVSRALAEARILARVRHPNVVSVFGADCHDGRFGLWMELIEGLALDELVAMNGTMSAREAAAIGVDVCHALAAVHGRRLLHRDVKASNVMREKGGRIVLMDLGAGRPIPPAGERVDRLAGTPLYLAPELLAGQPPSIASDIYSLGVMLYFLVSGDYPVDGADRSDVERAHLEERRRSLRDARPDLPTAFVEVVQRALHPDPKQRYRTAGDFGAALASSVGAHYQPDPRPALDWRIAAAAAAGLAVLLAVIIPPILPPKSDDATGVTTATSAPSPAAKSSEATAPAADPAQYQIQASFYAVRGGRNVRLAAGSRVAPGDRLFLSVESSDPVFVYVINQDERLDSYLLFPLPGYEPGNPVASGGTLPGSRNGERRYWEVTSAGGREHFFIYVARERLVEFEQLLAGLPRAEEGRPVESLPLPRSAVGAMRGVGGLAGPPRGQSSIAALVDLKPLPDASEAATGVWARRITFENPR